MAAPVAVFTDNVAQQGPGLRDLIKAWYPSLIPLPEAEQPMVIQDLWHARERIAKQLKKAHPDYRRALSSLKAVFARLR